MPIQFYRPDPSQPRQYYGIPSPEQEALQPPSPMLDPVNYLAGSLVNPLRNLLTRAARPTMLQHIPISRPPVGYTQHIPPRTQQLPWEVMDNINPERYLNNDALRRYLR